MSKFLFIFLILTTLLFGCKKPFFERWESSMDSCKAMCGSSGQDYSSVYQYGMGLCACNNEEGRKAAASYRYCLNNSCNLEKYK